MGAKLQTMLVNTKGIHDALLYGGPFGLSAAASKSTFNILAGYRGCLLPQAVEAQCSNSSRPLNSVRLDSLMSIIQSTFEQIAQVSDRSVAASFQAMGSEERLRAWKQDTGMQFLHDMTTQDLREGLKRLVSNEEQQPAVKQIHFEIRILFGVAVSYVIVIFYAGTFRRNVRNAVREAGQGRSFLSTIPVDKLSRTAAESIQDLFAMGGHDDEGTGE